MYIISKELPLGTHSLTVADLGVGGPGEAPVK